MQVQEIEWDKKDLERQLNELKLKFEQAERAAAEQRQVDEKKHAEEIQFLKRTNQQLKVSRNKFTELSSYLIKPRQLIYRPWSRGQGWKWDGMGRHSIPALPWSAPNHTANYFLSNTTQVSHIANTDKYVCQII